MNEKESKKKKRRVVLKVILVFCLFHSACSQSTKYIKTGNSLIEKREWEKSIVYLREAKEKYPNNAEISLLLFRAEWQASLTHLEKGEIFLQQGDYDRALNAFKTSLSYIPDNQHVKSMIRKTEKMKAASSLFADAERLMKRGSYGKAKEALETVLQLNPGNEDAQKLLAFFKADDTQEKGKTDSPAYQLRSVSSAPISLKFRKTPIVNVFEALSQISGVNFVFDKDMRETNVTLFMTDVSFDRFIDVLLRTNSLSARVINDKTMLIYPNTPEKAKEYEDLKIRTFYLENIEAQKMIAILSKILKNPDISANEKLNTLVIRGSSEVVALASRIIKANDRAPSEVLLNVEILEVKRDKEKQLGFEFSDTISLGIGPESPEIKTDSTRASFASLYSLESLSNKELLLSLPTATINLLKRDGDTKILAKPQIRVKNLEKAFIHVGDRVPIRSNRMVDSNGNETYDYAYQDVGIKLETTPIINMMNDISLTLSLEVSGLGNNVGTAADPQYAIRTRNAKTVLTMKDGEVIVIGGLISDEERESSKKVPLLSALPVLGALFSNLDMDNSETDILMVITPIVIKTQEMPEKNIQELWSGKERDFSLKEPFDNPEKKENLYQDFPNKNYFREMEAQKQSAPKQSIEMRRRTPSADLLLKEKPAKTIPGKIQKMKETDTQNKGPFTMSEKERESLWSLSTPYSVHVNSYQTQPVTDERVRELKSLGYDAFSIFTDIPGKGRYHRVFVGHFKNMVEANEALLLYSKRKEFARDIHVMNRRDAFPG